MTDRQGEWETAEEVSSRLDSYSAPEAADYVPLMMGEAPVGRIKVNLETGQLEGNLIEGFSKILLEGLEGGVLSVSFFGRASLSADVSHERLQNYIKDNS